MEHKYIFIGFDGESYLEKPLYGFIKYGNLISQLSSNPGRAALANSMIAPIKARIDYSGIGRKIFLVDQLPEGASPTYDNTPDDIKKDA
jgi:hypothetical protein